MVEVFSRSGVSAVNPAPNKGSSMFQKHNAQRGFRQEGVSTTGSEPKKMWTLDAVMALQKALENGIPEHGSADPVTGQKDNGRKEHRKLPSPQEQGEWSAHVPDITDFCRKLLRRWFPRKNSESMTA